MKSLLNEKALLIRIGIKRKGMYRMAMKLGYTHPLVVSISQELDHLLNRYQDKVS
ncbi:aspartyl-phosphate phosphatase Spo0E family protein [Psychrobacillus vulpis]|uniref:Aspartyl-phosphate phosphatase Spo0E family protein n=1 Tax=Psychrobacillus vulpis TaxID=2325572 RepID=A0A544TJD7_9BACI|nr:aspartyl-phosphate phosphatase Spo0E family protein [Psychrobacillus vulpis]TQR17533.1 aspartyl-phosphate phosphatase Spo0E family protein [Psychrobacillus vulpis]